MVIAPAAPDTVAAIHPPKSSNAHSDDVMFMSIFYRCPSNAEKEPLISLLSHSLQQIKQRVG
jgi:hypothetical protein